MKNFLKHLLSILIGIAILSAGILGAIRFVKTKPEAKKRPTMSSMVPVVETIPLTASSQTLKIDCLGTVIADKDAAIQPEVTGRITVVNPKLVEGELIKKGEVLVEIDDTDYKLALLTAEANLLKAKSSYRIEEGQQDVVRHELKLMGDQESGNYRDLMLREPQLKSAEAAIKSAQAAVESAKAKLARTKIAAPFDAVVVATEADIGDYAQPSKTLIELAAVDRYFIRASVPLSALEPLPKLGKQPYFAEITLSDGSTRNAETYKLLPDLTEKGRMARILLSAEKPYDAKHARPLLLNEVVRVNITGEIADNASLIPRKYLRDGNVLWMVDADRKLHVLPVELLQGYSDQVLVRINAEPGMELVITDLISSVDGMQLRRAGEHAPAQPETTRRSKPDGKRKQKQGA